MRAKFGPIHTPNSVYTRVWSLWPLPSHCHARFQFLSLLLCRPCTVCTRMTRRPAKASQVAPSVHSVSPPTRIRLAASSCGTVICTFEQSVEQWHLLGIHLGDIAVNLTEWQDRLAVLPQ